MKKKTILTALAAAAVAVSAQAQQVIKLEPGLPATLSSETPATSSGGNVSYQWYRDGNPIAGATSASYNLPASEAHGVNVEFRRGAMTPACGGYNFSNTITITFCLGLTVGNVCWAATNVAQSGKFASIPDMYTEFYQWNKSTAWAATGTVSGWSSTFNTSTTWTVNPCPGYWRLATQGEFLDLVNSGNTWVAANTNRATTAGRFFGPNHATCSLPNNMTGCIFIPVGGYRDGSNGALSSQTTNGYSWTATNYSSSDAYRLRITSSERIVTSSGKGYALPIRCVQ